MRIVDPNGKFDLMTFDIETNVQDCSVTALIPANAS